MKNNRKRCNLCDRMRPPTLEFFRADPKTKSGLTAKCIECLDMLSEHKQGRNIVKDNQEKLRRNYGHTWMGATSW